MTNLEALRDVLPKLSPSDANFAASLLRQAASRPLSPKQLPWVDKLIERASAPPKSAGPSAEVGSLAGILALFDKAKGKLKYPAIVLSVPAASMAVRISVAGPKSKAPGSLNVLSTERSEPGAFGNLQRAFFGRVGIDGIYKSSGKGESMFEALSARLKEFADSPAVVAAEHGKLTGNCCFCGLSLTDERSTAVGYGATCAKNWGMPWGSAAPVLKPAKRKAVATPQVAALPGMAPLGIAPREKQMEF